MARYGRDFTSSRMPRRGMGEFGSDYDTDFRGGTGRGYWSSDRGMGWGGVGRGAGYSDLDESWRSTGHGRGRRDFGPETWGGYNRPNFGEYGGTGYSGMGGYGSNFDRGYPNRETQYGRMGHEFGHMGHDYDTDFGDRLRRGWNRFRGQAREWMGRGYDRGW